MTLEDYIGGVRYEIQGNIVIKVEEPDGYKNVYESTNGINELEVDEHLNRIVDYIYATTNDNDQPVLVLELGEEDEY